MVKVLPTDLRPWSPIISSSSYPTLAIVFLLVGILLLALFFLYELATEKAHKKKNILKEVTLASLASVNLAFAALFILLVSGVYI